MRKFTTFLIYLLILGPLLAQDTLQPGPIKSNQKPWTHLELNNDNFQFVVVTDRTGGLRPGVFAEGVHKINLLQPEFVVSVGDLITGYTEDSLTLAQEWGEFDSIAHNFDMPFFYVAGNHDYTNPTMAKLWDEKFGANYYYFRYKNVLFLCLNSEDGATALTHPDLGAEQLAWAQDVLAKHPDVRWTMVMLHQPLWIHPEAKNWQKLEKDLDGRQHSVFCGHVHRYTLYQRNKSDYFTLATMGGGSGLRGSDYGEFDHFMWITMTEEGPYYANVMLDGVEGKEVYTEAQLKQAEVYNSQPPIKLVPWFLNDTAPSQFVFLVENPDTVARTVAVHPRGGQYFKVDEGMLRYELAPGDKKQITVEVQMTDTPDPTQSPFRAWVEFVGPDFVWTRSYRAFPNERLTIPAAPRRIKVDGKVNEWQDWAYQFGEAENSEDARVQFSVGMDDEMLYVAARVQDEALINGFGQEYDAQDGLILQIDPRALATSAYNPQEEEAIMRGEWMALIAQPAQAEFGLSYPMMLPKGVKGQGRQTSNGYVVEYAVPLSLLEAAQGGDWSSIRLNLILMDADTKTGKASPYTWMPEWKRHNVGAGTMFRAE